MTLICRGSAVLSSGPLVVPLTLFAASQPQAGVGGRKKTLPKVAACAVGKGLSLWKKFPGSFRASAVSRSSSTLDTTASASHLNKRRHRVPPEFA